MGGICGSGSGVVGSANTKSNDTGGSGNSFSETVANWFTPNDNMRYEDGILVDTSKGEGKYTPLPRNEAGAFTNIPDKSGITVTNRNRDNRTFTPDQQAKFTQKNSAREELANMFTPFDGAKYVGGNLVEEATGQSLTGGGFITNKMGANDYIYGVSDDFSNNAPLERGNMSNQDYAVALQKFKIRQSQLENIPPSDPAYFSSFIPGLTIPLVGGYLGKKMLEGGINDRRAMMDQHQAALNAGAKADMSDGVYRGYTGVDGAFVPYIENKNQDPLTDSNFGALNMGNNLTDDRSDPVVLPPETGMGGGETVPLATLTQPERMQSYEPIPMDPNTIVYASPMYEKFQFEVLPGILKQMPNMTQEDIDAAFILYRDRQKAAE